MNIFVVDNDPKKAAYQLCDKHVVKMILESCQLLCSVFPNNTAPYKPTHINHPCSKWVRLSLQNYKWLISHTEGLLEEYSKRYNKSHKCKTVLEFIKNNYFILNLPSLGLTEHPKCMPDDVKVNDVVESYRNYYIKYKTFAQWKHSPIPDWYKK